MLFSHSQDPKENRLSQWRDVELERGISQLSFHLASEPMEGTYLVVVEKASGKKVKHSFIVKEYATELAELSPFRLKDEDSPPQHNIQESIISIRQAVIPVQLKFHSS
ncbi:hypothetical protein JD844_010059 [Phrynosoma platyrhinos]|uniref:Uncharacterized protein n=1 Tax=Phrynosoma platyrhinos TaxID=52577 RepID=A0ABQ7TFZ2_PHRPL|nr:hypothetical protein JD844_010059 [Phrynosoma platyrhinos]